MVDTNDKAHYFLLYFWVDAVDVKSLGLLYEEMTSCGEDRLICGAGWRKAGGRLYPFFEAGQILPVGTSGCVELRFSQCYNLAKVITASLNKHWESTRSLDESLTDHADDLPVSKSRRSEWWAGHSIELPLIDLSKFKCGTSQQLNLSTIHADAPEIRKVIIPVQN